MKFTSKTSNRCAFLSTMPIPPNKEHSDDCSHRYKTIGKRGAREFYDTCTDMQATDKINACINLLKRRNSSLRPQKKRRMKTRKILRKRMGASMMNMTADWKSTVTDMSTEPCLAIVVTAAFQQYGTTSHVYVQSG